MPEPLEGIRATNDHPVLGLQFVVDDAGKPYGASELDAFVTFLNSILEGLGFDFSRGGEDLSTIAGAPVQWQRRAFTMYPLYVEKLTVSTAADAPALIQQQRPGEWVIAAQVLDAGSTSHFAVLADEWQQHLKELLLSQGSAVSGGFTYNVLQVEAAALKSKALDMRPLVLHAIAPDGSACDRGHLPSQKAIANAFWQTFWATGARRAERGATFPVAFLPIDRSSRYEFAAPFHERYVTLRRRFFGRTSILAFVNEALTSARALLFDTERNRFVVAAEFEPAAHGVAAADVLVAIGELNRTAFVDAFTGENEKRFAGWSQLEASHSPEPWPFNDSTNETQGDASLKIRAGTRESDYLRSVRAEGTGEHLVRIHRVVPYSGCAYLYECVHDIEDLRKRGKVQDFDGQVLAATNSTFFLNFPEEYATLHSAMNDPAAALVENGRTHQAKTLRRATFALGQDGSVQISTRAGNKLNSDVLVFEGESASASYAHNSQKSFAENKFGPLFFGSVVVGNSIVETFEEIATEIPSNGWIIGDSEAFGGRIEPRNVVELQLHEAGTAREVPIRHAFAVGPMLVDGGKIVPLGESKEDFQSIVLKDAPAFEESAALPRTGLPPALLNCDKRGVPPTRFPYDWNRTRAPRTAVGVREDGSVLLVVVDGRADLAHSIGATLAELAQLMLNMGCVSAMNMDGGGSSVMFVNDEAAYPHKLREHLRDGVVNLPSDMGGVERLLPVPLVIYQPKQA